MIQIDVSTVIAVVLSAYLVGAAACTWAYWPIMAPGVPRNARSSALATFQVVLAAAASRLERPSVTPPAPEIPATGGYLALPDMERKVVDHIVARLHLGLRQYGPLKVGDPRDWRSEARDEIYDAIVYRALDSMHVDRMGGHPGGAAGLKRDLAAATGADAPVPAAAPSAGVPSVTDHAHEVGSCSFCDGNKREPFTPPGREKVPSLGPCQLT